MLWTHQRQAQSADGHYLVGRVCLSAGSSRRTVLSWRRAVEGSTFPQSHVLWWFHTNLSSASLCLWWCWNPRTALSVQLSALLKEKQLRLGSVVSTIAGQKPRMTPDAPRRPQQHSLPFAQMCLECSFWLVEEDLWCRSFLLVPPLKVFPMVCHPKDKGIPPRPGRMAEQQAANVEWLAICGQLEIFSPFCGHQFLPRVIWQSCSQGYFVGRQVVESAQVTCDHEINSVGVQKNRSH